MLNLYNSKGELKEIVEKGDLYKTYRVRNVDYVNLQEARLFFDIFDGLYLIKARIDSDFISVGIVYWSGSYYGNTNPDIITFYNKGFSYTAFNNSGTIAFDATCYTIDVIPLMIV